MPRKRQPLLYVKLNRLLIEEAAGRKKMNINELSTGVAVKFRINRKEVKMLLKEMDTMLGVKKGRGNPRYSMWLDRISPPPANPAIKFHPHPY
jgi:hypothetical protein